MSVTANHRVSPHPSSWICPLLALAMSAPAVQAAADASAPPAEVTSSPPALLAAAGGLVAIATGPTVRWFDRRGQRLGQLPDDGARDRLHDRSAAREQGALARERAFDELDIPDDLRDRDDALDLAEDELSLSLRRQERAGADPADSRREPAGRAFVIVGRGGLIALVDRRLWQLELGRPPRLIGPAPSPLTALAGTDGGLILAARATDILASRDGGRSFTVIDRLPIAPHQLVVDPAGRYFAAASPGRLDLVAMDSGKSEPDRLVFQPHTVLRDLSACGDALTVLADDGVHLVTSDGRSRLMGAAAPGDRLGCSQRGSGSARWLSFGPGGLRPGGDAAGAVGTTPVPSWRGPVEAIAADGDSLWIYDRRAGLANLRDPGAPSLALPLSGERDVTIRRPIRSPWRGLLPHVAVLGRQSRDTGRQAVAFALMAEWRLGGGSGGDTPDGTGVAPTSTLPGLESEAPPAPGWPPRAPDPDQPCLARARARSVALAAAEPERARSLMARAGRSAWLPELRLRAEKRVGRSESLDYKPTASSDALGLDTDNAVRYEVRATWDLPRLVFNPEEIGAASQALRINETRREIESQVNRLYYERRRLLLAPASAGAEDGTTWQIRIEELEADLDALSGGAFTRCSHGQHVEVP
jgi:hypothetical protein